MIRDDNNHKSVTKKRHDFTKPEREYVKGIVHNLSFQRLTDQEIVQWLHDEKQIDLDRSTVSKMRNHVELKAEKWYIELKQSTFKYIAIYKERVDSLFSYQKKLHEIISATKKPEVQIRAISELHSIEMSIFSLWKQLPALDIVDTNKDDHNSEEYRYDNVGLSGLPRAICTVPRKMKDSIGRHTLDGRKVIPLWIPASEQSWKKNTVYLMNPGVIQNGFNVLRVIDGLRIP